MVASLLPNGEQVFLDNNGIPLASGSVFFYIPGTTTFKTTWEDPAQTIPNANPVILDASGRAIIYGSGQYRQRVLDVNGNLIWDQLTADTTGITVGTSTTSLTIGLGSKTFTTQTGLDFVVGQFATATSAGTPSDFMAGVITSYTSSTGVLVMNVLSVGGSGDTHNDWIITSSGAIGPPGNFLGPEANLASASTTDLGSAGVYILDITGVTTINSFGSSASVNNPLYFLRFAGILTITNSSAIICPGGKSITTAANGTLTAQYLGSGNWFIRGYAAPGGPVVYNTCAGYLPTSQTFSSSTVASMTITAGQTSDSTNTVMIVGGPFSWNITNGNVINGFQGGTTLPNSTAIHFFAISKADDTVPASFASTSTAPTLPTGYVYYRRIFSLSTSSSGVLQAGTPTEINGGGLTYYLATQVKDVDTSSLGTSATLYTLSTPGGVKVQPLVRAQTNNNGNFILLTSPDETDVAVGSAYNVVPMWDVCAGTSNATLPTGSSTSVILITNTSSQIRARANQASVTLAVITRGWIDFRRS